LTLAVKKLRDTYRYRPSRRQDAAAHAAPTSRGPVVIRQSTAVQPVVRDQIKNLAMLRIESKLALSRSAGPPTDPNSTEEHQTAQRGFWTHL